MLHEKSSGNKEEGSEGTFVSITTNEKGDIQKRIIYILWSSIPGFYGKEEVVQFLFDLGFFKIDVKIKSTTYFGEITAIPHYKKTHHIKLLP
jgi:hypothetical protein